MKLGTQVGLGPGHSVLDGDPGRPPPKGHSPQFSAHIYCGQIARWIKMLLGVEVGLDRSDISLDGDAAPLPKNGTEPPIFGQCLLWPNNWVDQDATWYEGRSRPRPHCVTWGPSSLLPSFGPCLLWPNGRPSQPLLSTYYTMLARLVMSYFILLWCNPVKLMAKDICERRLGLCRYAEYRHVASLVICLVTGALHLQAGQSLKCDPARSGQGCGAGGRAAR